METKRLGYDEVLDFGFEWSDDFESTESVDTSTWTIPSGLTKVAEAKDADSTKVWLTPASNTAATYTITNKIVTEGGERARTFERSMGIRVLQR